MGREDEREDGDALSTLPVPDSDSLIIGSRDDPRVLVMEEDGSNIVEIWDEESRGEVRLEGDRGLRKGRSKGGLNSRPLRVKRHFLVL